MTPPTHQIQHRTNSLPGLRRPLRALRRSLRALRRSLLASFGVGLSIPADALAAGDSLHIWPPDWPLVLALIVFFVLLVLPLDALLFRPIFAALDARRERIAGTRERAEQLEAEAKESLAHYEDAVREVRDEAEEARKAARNDAREASQAETDAARADTEGVLDDARREITREFEAARATLGQRADALAREAAATVLGRSLT